jgi:hypothetical protein
MKKTFRLLTSFLVVFIFISCSSDDNDVARDSEILGVWEVSEVSNTETIALTLVFGEENTGLRIYTIVETSGNETSSLETFTWEFNDNVVTVFDIDSTEHNYEINDDGYLEVSEEGEDVVLEKITNDYSAYY